MEFAYQTTCDEVVYGQDPRQRLKVRSFVLRSETQGVMVWLDPVPLAAAGGLAVFEWVAYEARFRDGPLGAIVAAASADGSAAMTDEQPSSAEAAT